MARRKSDYTLSRMAQDLDVAEMMARPTVIPVRIHNTFPEPKISKRDLDLPAESLGDAYVLTQSREALKEWARRVIQEHPYNPPETPPNVTPLRPRRRP